MILGPTARPFVVLGGEFARLVRRRGELVMAVHDISTRVKDGESKVSRMDEAVQWSQSLLSFDAGASSTSQNSPIVCPKPTVRVRGWNQAEKVGVGVRWGAFQPEMTRGWGACLMDAARRCRPACSCCPGV